MNHLVTPVIKTDVNAFVIDGNQDYRIAISDRCCSMYWKAVYVSCGGTRPTKEFVAEAVSSAIELFKVERLKHRKKMNKLESKKRKS